MSLCRFLMVWLLLTQAGFGQPVINISPKSKASLAGFRFIDGIEKAASDGSMPSFPTLLAMIASDKSLSRRDIYPIIGCYTVLQNSEVSSPQLSNLFATKWERLSSLLCEYTVTVTGDPSWSPDTPSIVAEAGLTLMPGQQSRKAVFCRQKGRYRLDYQTLNQEKVLRSFGHSSYDGTSTRTATYGGSLGCTGNIQQGYYPAIFHPRGSPLNATMLIPEGATSTHAAVNYDFRRFSKSGFVYETPVKIDGCNCYVYGNTNLQVYLSLDHGYAVKQIDISRYLVPRGPNATALEDSSTYERYTSGDFVELAKGVWLPNITRFERIKHGKIAELIQTNVTRWQLNPKIEGNHFTDIFPGFCDVVDQTGDKPRLTQGVYQDGSPKPRATAR